MFLRATKRFKDGKVHLYWSMVENVRVGRRVFQRRALFLFLRERWAGLFGSTCDVVLFDLTSTYFEVDGVKALDSDLQRYVEPKENVALLLGALGLTLPAQPPPKISGNAAPQKTEV